MKKITLLLLIAFFQVSNAQDYIEKLKKEVVEMKDGKFIINDMTLVTINENNVFQVLVHCESPETIISRDNFVYIAATIINDELSNFGEAQNEDLDEITGTPDVLINCYMTKTGIQIDRKSEIRGNSKITRKWIDLL